MFDKVTDFKKYLSEFKIDISEEKVEQFSIYYRLLCEFNSHTNLVSSTEIETVYLKHFVDSLSINLIKNDLNIEKMTNLIDIGIGGGFPGVPMLILYDNLSLVALDSVKKKLNFIEILAKELNFQDRVTILGERAEIIGKNPMHRGKYDLALTRAVGQLNVISEFCLPLVKKEGFFVAYKAKNIEEEINTAQNAIKILGGKLFKNQGYKIINQEEYERNLVVIKKIANTSNKYPRNIGIPKKSPLI